MKAVIVSLLFLALSGIRVPASFAQQDQNYQKLAQEMEVLKTQLSAVQSQLQTVENVEKIKLLAELADVKAKLVNTEFGKLERDLRDSNDGWLMKWNGFYIGVLAVIGVALWFSVKSLIADRVEKSLSGFKEALAQADTLKNEFQEVENKIRVLNKEHAAKVVESFMHYPLDDADSYPEQVKELSDEVLLDVLGDEIQDLYTRIRTLEILTRRGSTRSISPALKFLNSTLDSHQDKELDLYTADHLKTFVYFLGWIPAQETYEGLTTFLNRLLFRENKEFKALLLAATATSIVWCSCELNKKDWLSLLNTSISQLVNEPETIKGILHHLPDQMPRLGNFEDYLLDLLEKHEPEYVNDWRERRAATNTETEETS